MPLPCPKKANTDLGCSPKPMSNTAQSGIIHVGQPWSTSQARNNSGSRTNLAGQWMGQPCSTPSQQQDQPRLVASFPRLTKGSSWLDWCKPSCWCRALDHSSWNCSEDTGSLQWCVAVAPAKLKVWHTVDVLAITSVNLPCLLAGTSHGLMNLFLSLFQKQLRWEL